jgi:type VI secretion system secreted protein VgrG
MPLFGEPTQFVEPQVDPLDDPRPKRRRIPFRWIVIGGLGALVIVCCAGAGIVNSVANAMRPATSSPTATLPIPLVPADVLTVRASDRHYSSTPEGTATLITVQGMMTKFAFTATGTLQDASPVSQTQSTETVTATTGTPTLTGTTSPSQTPVVREHIVVVVATPTFTPVVVTATLAATPYPTYTPFPTPSYTPYPTYTAFPTYTPYVVITSPFVVTVIIPVTVEVFSTMEVTREVTIVVTATPTETAIPTDTPIPTETPTP